MWKIILLTAFVIDITYALNNGLALTPPMGWLAWERFRCNTNCAYDPHNCISERLFMEMADRLVFDGFRDAGYNYINIDDCWMSNRRDSSGRLVPDPGRFPSGIKFLSRYMHQRGLKLGIYQDFGSHTCMGFPGILEHNMETDAATFAEWEVDYIKLDGCHSRAADMDKGYTKMGSFLNQTGRSMVYSCSWPFYQLAKRMEPNYTLIAKSCNLWRNFDDIQDSWPSILKILDFYGDNQEVLVPIAGPGHWNDPDMLILGNYGLSYEQAKTQMAMWAILASPLLMSNDLRSLDQSFKKILLNRHVIAVNQDVLGIQGKRIFKKDNVEIWKRPISPIHDSFYSYAIVFLNRRTDGVPTRVSTTLGELGLKNPAGYHLLELFGGFDYGKVNPAQLFSVSVSPTGIVMVRANTLKSNPSENVIV